jgi:hypothetical protein
MRDRSSAEEAERLARGRGAFARIVRQATSEHDLDGPSQVQLSGREPRMIVEQRTLGRRREQRRELGAGSRCCAGHRMEKCGGEREEVAGNGR